MTPHLMFHQFLSVAQWSTAKIWWRQICYHFVAIFMGKMPPAPGKKRYIYKVRMHIGYRNTLFVWEYNTPQKDRPVECLENCDNWQTLLKLWKTLKLWNNLVKQFSKALGLREAGRNLPNSGPFRGWWAGLGWWVEGWVRWWFKQVEWWRNHEKHL
jgi:hypothetical protein